jgi:hypothetical protein
VLGMLLAIALTVSGLLFKFGPTERL